MAEGDELSRVVGITPARYELACRSHMMRMQPPAGGVDDGTPLALLDGPAPVAVPSQALASSGEPASAPVERPVRLGVSFRVSSLAMLRAPAAGGE